MTANPVRPARHRPGKGVVEEPSSEEEESGDEEEEQREEASQPSAPAPKASSFPSAKITSNLKDVDLDARRKEAAAQEAARLQAEADAKRKADDDEFETEESEAGSGEEGSESEAESEEEEESSSEDERRKKLMRPVFVRKGQRQDTNGAAQKSEEEEYAEQEKRRKERANALVQEQLAKNRAERAAGRKFWDDEDEGMLEEVDDTDDVDPEAEYAAWKLRELKRIKRERDALIAAEKEREEVERRRNLSKEEREAEDREFLEAQSKEKEGRGEAGYLKRYFHKGAFFQEDAEKLGLKDRDIMGARFQDEVNREVLPEYMQVRDQTKIGKKGRTRYKDLRSEDTGRWGDFSNKRRGDSYQEDERFRPDYQRDGPGATGANSAPVGERRRREEDGDRQSKRPRRDS